MTSDGLRLGLYLKICDGKIGIDGLFKREGLTGMLEISYMRKIDMISPFLGGLMDGIGYQMEICPITTTFTDYVYMADVCGILLEIVLLCSFDL